VGEREIDNSYFGLRLDRYIDGALSVRGFRDYLKVGGAFAQSPNAGPNHFMIVSN
jgi:hypothetical protein